ncbi:MAG: ABC transporter permease [Nocardioidaceae bacterium]
MTAALRYEWRRFTTLRSTWWLIGLGLLLPGGLSFLIATALSPSDLASEPEFSVLAVVTQGAAVGITPLLVAYMMALFGVFNFGHEYRHGMIRATLTAVPSRVDVLAAKTLTTGGVAALVSGVSGLIGVGMATAFLPSNADVNTTEVWGVVLGSMLYSTMFALVGMGLAAIFRNQVAALVVILVVPVVAEPIIRAILVVPDAFNGVQGLASYLPFSAGSQMYSRLSLSDGLRLLGYQPFGQVGGGVMFGVFTLVILVVASVLFLKRDA